MAQAGQRDTTWRSGRQLLVGGTSMLAAVLAAEAIGRPAPAYAGTDDDVVAGALNNASSQTTVKCTTAGDFALEGAAAGSGIGLVGFSGSGPGVSGRSDAVEGLYAQSGTAAGSFLGAPVGYARLSSSTGMVRTPAVWRSYPAKPG